MNKKFLTISIGIVLVFSIFLIVSKVIFKDKVVFSDGYSYSEYDSLKLEVKYLGYEEDKNVYKIRVGIKNKSDYIANLGNTTLVFDYRANSGNSNENNSSGGNPTFSGYDKQERDYHINYKWDESQLNKERPRTGLDPGEEREYVFEVTKGLSFNPDNYDTNKMTIGYGVYFYKYRRGSTVFVNKGSISAGERIDNEIQPFTIK